RRREARRQAHVAAVAAAAEGMRAAVEAAPVEVEADALGDHAHEALLRLDRQRMLVEGVRGLARRAVELREELAQPRPQRREDALDHRRGAARLVAVGEGVPRLAALAVPAVALRLVPVEFDDPLEPRAEAFEVGVAPRFGPLVLRLARD